MDRVQVFLRSPLFTLKSDGHLPHKTAILEGTVIETQGAGLQIQVTTWRDSDGKALEGDSRTLFIPPSKIDHVWLLD
jgi:hypothetical protein